MKKNLRLLLSCIGALSTMVLTAQNTQPNVLPDWAMGGFVRPAGANPVISPNAASEFFCPMNQATVKWEESDAFNPAAVVKDGKICVLYRAEDNSATGIGSRVSRVALAESTDGVTMTKRSAPVLYPDDNNKQYEWPGGCEDPRVAVTEDGTYVIFYTAWDRNVARLCVATSTDLLTWQKHGPVFATAYNGKYKDTWSKAASIVTKLENDKLVISKIDGKYFMYWGEYVIYGATSDDLVNWTPVEDAGGSLKQLISPRKGYFDSDLTECGPPAIITDKGILLLYNGKNKTNEDRDFRFNAGTYSAGQVLADKNDPFKVISRLDVPFFRPMEDYEKSGQYVDGTVFIEGLVYYNSKWYLYYGCADSEVGVAVYDPASPANGDPIPDVPTGNGIGGYPLNGIGKKIVSIHSSSGSANSGESAFNLLYTHIDSKKKWCDNVNENPWVVFELTDVYAIDKLAFRDVSPYENGNGNVPEYWIFVSTTGTADGDWTEIVHKTNQGAVAVKEDVFETPVNARYIKFVASRGTRTDNGEKENAIRIYGFDIYGTLSQKIDRGDLVSVGKTVLKFYDASNYFEQPLHLIDGNTTNSANKWAFYRAGEGDSLKYVVIDLEQEYDIEKFKIYDTHYLEPNTDKNINGYNIYLSTEAPDLSLITNLKDDNTVWTQVVNANGRGAENIKTDIITPTKGRFVKLEIPRSRVDGTTRLFEFEVYKKESNAIEQNTANNLKVWPSVLNNNESLNISNTEAGKIYVYAADGSLTTSKNIPSLASVHLDIPAGSYIAMVLTPSITKSFKIIKK